MYGNYLENIYPSIYHLLNYGRKNPFLKSFSFSHLFGRISWMSQENSAAQETRPLQDLSYVPGIIDWPLEPVGLEGIHSALLSSEVMKMIEKGRADVIRHAKTQAESRRKSFLETRTARWGASPFDQRNSKLTKKGNRTQMASLLTIITCMYPVYVFDTWFSLGTPLPVVGRPRLLSFLHHSPSFALSAF